MIKTLNSSHSCRRCSNSQVCMTHFPLTNDIYMGWKRRRVLSLMWVHGLTRSSLLQEVTDGEQHLASTDTSGNNLAKMVNFKLEPYVFFSLKLLTLKTGVSGGKLLPRNDLQCRCFTLKTHCGLLKALLRVNSIMFYISRPRSFYCVCIQWVRFDTRVHKLPFFCM